MRNKTYFEPSAYSTRLAPEANRRNGKRFTRIPNQCENSPNGNERRRSAGSLRPRMGFLVDFSERRRAYVRVDLGRDEAFVPQ